MSNHPAKPPVTFTNRNTGETSLLEQSQGRKPRPAMDPAESVEPPASTTQEALATARGSVPQSVPAGAEPVTVLTFETDRQNDEEPAKASRNKRSKNPGNTGKAQDDIETLDPLFRYSEESHHYPILTMQAWICKYEFLYH